MARSLRSLHNIKIRMPISTIYIVTKNQNEQNMLIEMQEIILDEINAKEMKIKSNEEDLITYKAKANFKELGKKLGKDMKTVSIEISKLKNEDIIKIINGISYEIKVGNTKYYLSLNDIILEREEKDNLKVINEESITIGIDSLITKELYLEGLTREFVRQIQNLRKEKNFDVSDRINLYIENNETLQEILNKFEKYIKTETLALNIIFNKSKLEKK